MVATNNYMLANSLAGRRRLLAGGKRQASGDRSDRCHVAFPVPEEGRNRPPSASLNRDPREGGGGGGGP